MKSPDGPHPASVKRDHTAPWFQDKQAMQARAIVLLAEDMLTHEQIADDVGVSVRTLHYWMHQDHFEQRLLAARERLDGAALRTPIARKYNRVRALNDRWEALQQVAAERSRDYVNALLAHPDPTPIPGGASGYLLPGTATLDRVLLTELRELEKQAAIEVNQWQDGARAPITINVTVKNEAERLAARLGIPVEDLLLEAEAILVEAQNDA